MEDDYMFCVNTLNEMRKLPNELKGKNREQRISLFFHYTMLRFNFSPIWEELKEENNEGEGGVGSSSTISSLSNNNNNNKNEAKIKEGWSKGGVFSFLYSHPALPSTLVHLKMVPMGHLLLVHSTFSPETSALFSLEVNMNEHISEYMTENEGEFKWKALQMKFKNAIVYAILPSLQPPTPSLPPSSLSPPGSKGDPLRISEPKQPFFAPSYYSPSNISPYNVGHNDAFPNFGGGFGGSGGGMQVGPNHAMFKNYPAPQPQAFYHGDDDDDFHFNPSPNPNCPPLSPNHPHGPLPAPRYDPVGPLPSQNKNNDKKDKRSPFGPDPDHLRMPGGDKDWYI